MRKADPKASPARTVTNFSDSLSCMDDLFLAKKIKRILISSEDIKDEAKRGKMGNGGTDMLISAISEISSTSNAVRYVGYKSSIPDFAALNLKHVPSALVIPDYYIVGSISQADDFIIMNQQGFGAATNDVDTGYSYNDSVSVVAIDLNLFEVETGMQLPGITSRNSLAYTRHGKSGDLGGMILKTGVSFFVNFTRNEGPQQAVRTLLELSLVELMGKLTKLPYWDCLDLDISSKEMHKTVAKWWAVKSEKEKMWEVQHLLLEAGRLSVVPRGAEQQRTLAAIKEFQHDNDMLPDAKVSLPLFIKLKSQGNTEDHLRKPTVVTEVENYGGREKKDEPFRIWKIDGGGGDFGSRSSMALGSDGSKHVAYFDPLKRSLKYAKKNGPSWLIETLDSNLETSLPKDIAVHIAVDSQNKPHILYSVRPKDGGAVIRYASNGTTWEKEVIKMLFDSESRYPGAYIYFSEGRVNLLYSGAHLTHVEKEGNQWVSRESYDMTEYPDLDLQKLFVKKGKIYLSYGKFNELVTAWSQENEWEVRRVLLGKQLLNTSVLVDSKGNLHTVGFSEDGEIIRIVSRKASGTILKKESLKKISSGSDPSQVQIAATIAHDDTIHILYSVARKIKDAKPGLFHLKVNTDGSKNFSKIEEGDFTARSVMVDSTGSINFIYLDNNSGDLLFGVSSEGTAP